MQPTGFAAIHNVGIPDKPSVEEPPKQTFGTLGNVHRLVARHAIKDRIALLESIIQTHQPLMQAMRITQNAFQQGVMEGIRQVAAAEREKEQKQTAQELQPGETPVATSPIVEDEATVAAPDVVSKQDVGEPCSVPQ